MPEGLDTAKIAQGAQFAPYREHRVEAVPQVKPYQVQADLGNVENRERFVFSPEAQSMLAKNGFVVLPMLHREFFMLYEFNRYDAVPNFITTDAMLHNYHLFFDYLLKTTEDNLLFDELDRLNRGMLDVTQR